MSGNKKMEYQKTTQNKLNSEKDDVLKKMLEIRFDQPVTVKVNFQEEEDDIDYSKQEKLMKGLNNVGVDGCAVIISPDNNDVIALGIQNTNSKDKDEKSDQNHIVQKTDKTIAKIKFQDKQNINSNKESTEIKKETQFTPTESVSLYFENPLINPKRETVASAVIDGIKNNYKTFPRIKVTSRRDIPKLPGKISAMKKNTIETTSATKTPPIVKDVSNSISCSSIKSEQKNHNHNETTPTTSLQANKSVDIRKHLEYQSIFKDTLNDAQRSIQPVNVEITSSCTNATSLSLEKISRENNICDPRHRALKTVAENVLGIFPHLNHYLRTKPREAHNKEMFQRAQKQYYATKIQKFGLSFSNVVSYILPHKDNAAYMKAFYQLVNIMARESKLQDFSQYNLEIICSEMIGWAENKKLQMKAFNNNVLSRIQQDQLLTVGSNNNACNQNLRLTQSTQSNTVFSRSENMSSSRRQTNAKPGAFSQDFATGPLRKEVKINYISKVQRANKPSTSNVQSNLAKNSTVTINQISCKSQGVYPVLIPNVTETTSSTLITRLSNNPSQKYYNATPLLQTHQQQNTPLQTTYPQANVSFSLLRSLRPPLLSYHQNLIERQIQPQNYQTEEQNINHLRSTVIQERSSVSRDSGFMSPVGDNSVIERMDTNSNDCPVQMLNHVNSVNPQVNYIPTRRCQVCGTMTNLRCRGCDRDYYCRPHCQELAWETHKASCHK